MNCVQICGGEVNVNVDTVVCVRFGVGDACRITLAGGISYRVPASDAQRVLEAMFWKKKTAPECMNLSGAL